MNKNMTDEMALRFADLEKRYGKTMAYDLLLTIEKLAKIQDEIAKAVSSHDERLQRAMGRLEAINFGEMQ
jgi:hypothetical protein